MTYKDVFKIRHRRCSYAKKALLDYLLSITTCDNIVDNGNGFDIPLHLLRGKSDCFLNHMTTFLRYISTVDYIDRENNCIHFYLFYGYDKNRKNPRSHK